MRIDDRLLALAKGNRYEERSECKSEGNPATYDALAYSHVFEKNGECYYRTIRGSWKHWKKIQKFSANGAFILMVSMKSLTP